MKLIDYWTIVIIIANILHLMGFILFYLINVDID